MIVWKDWAAPRCPKGSDRLFREVTESLESLLGSEYMEAVCRCAVKLGGLDDETAERLAREPVAFYDSAAQARQRALLSSVGEPFLAPFCNQNTGAATMAFQRAAHNAAAPVGGRDIFRVGEDGRLYLAAKSEHYHTPLGHAFGGYRLVDRARQLGIPNATHNNTRGYITRRMERELVRCANGLHREDTAALEAVLASEAPGVLNRIINLETGSLAVEAGLKMMLGRFYRLDRSFAAPVHAGKTPVFFVMADHNGGLEANYHGTTVLAQTLRGLWPEFAEAAGQQGMYRVVGVRINDAEDFREKILRYNTGKYRTAGFLHEIVLMNYGGIRLTEEYLRQVYALCREYDTPTLVDEIQSCMWYRGMFLFRLYGLQPDFVILGKGFPGGEYPASKILTTAAMDNLNQFGALVTNGQEELASLSYLVTMAYAEANGEEIERLGNLFERGLTAMTARHPKVVSCVEGRGHLASVHFFSVDEAVRFVTILNNRCMDVSAQTYKPNCPPAALVKMPWIASEEALRYLLDQMERALAGMEEADAAEGAATK